MIGGAHLSTRRGEGKGNSVWGRFPAVEAETGQGVSGAHGPAGSGEEGGGPGRSGLAHGLGQLG
jgi:hypothetical protein